MKIAVFCPNWVGDLVMATPALRGLRRQFPAAEVVAVLRPQLASVLAGLDLADRQLWHEPHAPQGRARAGLSGWEFARALRAEKFDLALLLPNSFRSAWWAWVGNCQRRVGFDGNGRRWLLTDAVARRPRNEPFPVLDEYLRLAAAAGCQNLDRTMELAVLREDEAALEAFWKRAVRGGVRPRGVVCLNPGGAFGAAKHWPTEHFVELARRVANELHRTVLVLCGPAERNVAREISVRASHPLVFSLADETVSIGLTKAAVKNAELLVTTDSGPRHFAAPFQVPVITLYGPTHPAWSETHYELGIPLQHRVDCGPCQRRVCPLGHHRCLRDLAPSRVFAEVAATLERQAVRGRVA